MSAVLNIDNRVPGHESGTQAERLARRTTELFANDQQFREATALAAVNEAKSTAGLSLAQIASLVMEAYADRPALGQRARELITDPVTGRKTLRQLPEFQTTSYREVWAGAGALASVWHHEPAMRIHAGEFICILAFAGSEYVVVDLAAIRLGAVSVPLQTNAPVSQLIQIVAEVEPRCLATSIDCLDLAVEIILSGQRPGSLLVFDYRAEDDAQRELYESALQRLSEAGCPMIVKTLDTLCAQGARLPPAPLFNAPAGGDTLSTIYYTSGSTGSPKGAMYPERMLKGPWLVNSPTPLICLDYMPQNHSYGRSIVFMTLGNGGVCYFTAKSDLSALFEDIRLVRPTQMVLVPRICEMIFHEYQSEMQRRTAENHQQEIPSSAVLAQVREKCMGGRLLAGTAGSAPITAELRGFIENYLDFELSDGYGTTETAAISINTFIMRPPVIDYKLVDVPELGYFRTDKPYPRGELLVKTANIMLGYYKRPELTQTFFDEYGYYKTGDIMAEIGPDQIVYVDRRNNVMKLSQGEFVAIAKLEALFTSGHPSIRQVYLYGSSDRSYLLAVIVPHTELRSTDGQDTDTRKIKLQLRNAIKEIARTEKLNAYEVPRDFLVENEPFSVENSLLAGIGKYNRPALKTRYGARLEELYTRIAESRSDELRNLRSLGRDAPVLETAARAVQATLGIEDLDITQRYNFSELGGDSLSALSFSLLLEEIFGIEVPVGVITNPASSLQNLAQYIDKERQGGANRATFSTVHGIGATQLHARDLTLEKFIDAPTLEKAKSLALSATGAVSTVLLTGANGYLGRFLCLEWLERLAKTGGNLICIARGQSDAEARQRIVDVFDSGDVTLKQRFDELAAKHLEVLAGDLGELNLGLGAANWKHLAKTVDLIVHPAALVNHVLPYSHLFGPNVVGTAELIRLAITTRLKPFINVSTVAAAMLDDGSVVDENVDIRMASAVRSINTKHYANGYANSKWAGEVLLRDAHDRFGLPVTVFRSDMILAHSRYGGQINVPDMFTRWIYSLLVTGLAPLSFYLPAPEGETIRAHYDGLPVDFTAEAISTLGVHALTGYRTYHVINPHDDGISQDQFVNWMIEAGHPIQRIADYNDWFTRFETALRALPENQRQHSSLPLIHQLRQPVSGLNTPVSADNFRAGVKELKVGPQKDIPHLSKPFILKYVDDLRLLKLI